MNPRDYQLDAYWMPFTSNRHFKSAPRMFVSAQDMHYVTDEGRRVLDGAAGLWCVNAGHCRPSIVEAVRRQVGTMDYSPAFQMGHPAEFRVATLIGQLAPADLDHVFFANSGSEAVDSALKIALAYHRTRGEGHRTVLVGRERGYHGVGFGGISVGGMSANRKAYGSMLPRVDHLPHTHNLQENAFFRGQPSWGAHLADELENRIIALHDASNIAAVIVEPVAGSTGVLIPPKGYLQRLRAICDKYGLLLIFDEVITGFGRTGHAFAAVTFDVVPDMITFAKGVTNGTIPLSGVIVRREIYETIVNAAPPGIIDLFHGYTYSGHPVAIAAAEATLALYHEERLFERARELAPYFEDAVHHLKDAPNVIDVRNFGMMAAVELAPRPGQPGARGFDAFLKCFANGVLVRVTGDIIALSPPLIISENQIDELTGVLHDALREI
jgi:beta-alanine--pyruvate transaminase